MRRERCVRPDSVIDGAHALDEAGKAGIDPGPDVPCYRWDDEAERWTPALDAVTFHVTNLGIPLAVFFTCREPRVEKAVGKSPIYVVCECHSGSLLPRRGAFPTRQDAMADAKGFLSRLEEGQRKAAMEALRQLGRQRGGKR